MEYATYTVRDENGIMLARLVGESAEKIFSGIDGEWNVFQPKGQKRTVAYTITRDASWTFENRYGAMRLYLWKGTKVIKD